MKILITGADSFIGKSLIELLSKEKYQIVAKNHKELDLLNFDKLRDFFEEEKYFDFIIHTAAVGGRRYDPDTPRIFYENVQMFDNLIQFKKRYKRIITFGSGAEFDSPHSAKESDLNENFILNYYGNSKKYITNKVRKLDLPVVILRLFGCCGKYESELGFIKSNIKRYKNNQPIIIHQNKWMDFIYINHLAIIIEIILNSNRKIENGDYNVVYKDKNTLVQVANMINNLGDYKVPIRIEELGVGNSYTGEDTSRWFQVLNLEDGIKEMYNDL
jgi:nucleoside-diphosphate-sugar epimerase